MSASPLLDIKDLGVTFVTDSGEVTAVDDLSLQVAPGEVLAIVGESGSGKSVSAKAILGLLPETATASGAILLSGEDVLSLPGRRLREIRGRDAAMVFQEPSTTLNPVFTIGWQIIEGLRAHNPKLSRKAGRARAIEVLGKVGIPDAAARVDYYPHQFSGGQKQRIVIAMALALDSQLILADEPTTALDVTVQAEILDLLRTCRDEFGASIVLITHNMGVVADLADRVAVMYQGKLVETATAQRLFAEPQEDYTKNLLGSVPHLGRDSMSSPETGRTVAADAEAIVEARDLVIEYPGGLGTKGFKAVRGVSFSVRAGEVYGLVGESGSGKTTIGRAVAGLGRGTGGSLRVLGQELVPFKERTFKALRQRIGFVFQDPAASFNPQLSIGDCVAEPLAVHRPELDAAGRRKAVADLLDAVQLPVAFADRFPHELSGGQRQRASLARGLALEPELLIADEPTSALDVSVQARVLQLFRELQAERGFAAIFISHDLAVVDMLAHRVGVLYRGELVEQGTGWDVLTAPTHPYTQRLVASLPVPDPAEQARRREELRRIAPA